MKREFDNASHTLNKEENGKRALAEQSKTLLLW